MPEEMLPKNRLILDSTRVVTFCSQNLLVQANAIVQRMESVLEIYFSKIPPKEFEHHPMFPVFTKLALLRSNILSGKSKEAENLASEISKILQEN